MEEVLFALSGERHCDNPIAHELDGFINRETPGERHVKLDLSHVPYISSMDIGTLISLHKSLKKSGGRLTLHGVSGNTLEVLKVCKLDKFLNIEGD